MAFLTDGDVSKVINRCGGAALLGADDLAIVATDLAPRAQAIVKKYLGWSVEQATFTEFLPETDTRLPESPLESRQFGSLSIDGPILTTEPTSELHLKEKFLRSVTSIYENRDAFAADVTAGDFSAGFALLGGGDYTIDWDEPGISRSSILRRNGAWPTTPRSVKVTYVAGLTAAELLTDEYVSIKEAAMLTIQFWYLDLIAFRKKRGQGGFGVLTAETLGDWSVTYGQGGIMNRLGMNAQIPPRAIGMLREFKSMAKWIRR